MNNPNNNAAIGGNEETVTLNDQFSLPDPSAAEMMAQFQKLNAIYGQIPETTCAHKQVCCKAGNPHMSYLEFLNVRNMIEETYSKEQRITIHLESLKRYLGRDVSKPCMFLKSSGCSIYEHRQFNCRFYGIVPKNEYEKRSKEIISQFGGDENFPLAKQCPFVKTKDGSQMTSARYNKIIDSVMDLDIKIGFPRKEVSAGKNYHTFHDWFMLAYYGESFMALATEIRLNGNEEAKNHILETIEKELTVNI